LPLRRHAAIFAILFHASFSFDIFIASKMPPVQPGRHFRFQPFYAPYMFSIRLLTLYFFLRRAPPSLSCRLPDTIFAFIFVDIFICHPLPCQLRLLPLADAMPPCHADCISRLRRHASHAAAATPLPPPFFIAAAILMADCHAITLPAMMP
jgi:hypothetical protein